MMGSWWSWFKWFKHVQTVHIPWTSSDPRFSWHPLPYMMARVSDLKWQCQATAKAIPSMLRTYWNGSVKPHKIGVFRKTARKTVRWKGDTTPTEHTWREPLSAWFFRRSDQNSSSKHHTVNLAATSCNNEANVLIWNSCTVAFISFICNIIEQHRGHGDHRNK